MLHEFLFVFKADNIGVDLKIQVKMRTRVTHYEIEGGLKFDIAHNFGNNDLPA